MQLALKFRDMLSGRLGNVVGEELDQLIAGIVSYFTVEHNEDGTHSDVTADSLVVSGDAEVTGEMTAGAFYGPGIGIEDIPETSIADGSLLARVGDTETITGAWAFSTLPTLAALNGYIKGTAGSLSASASIAEADITDGSLLARLAANETITGAWTFQSTLTISSTAPQSIFYESDAAADTKYWRWVIDAGVMSLGVLTDAFGSEATVLSVNRSTNNVRSLTLNASLLLGTAYAQTGLTGSYNDVGTGTNRDAVSIYHVSASSANVTWTGLTGGVTGKMAYIFNAEATYTLTLNHEDAGSSASNRFGCPGAANYVIPTYGGVCVVYYGGRWQIMGKA